MQTGLRSIGSHMRIAGAVRYHVSAQTPWWSSQDLQKAMSDGTSAKKGQRRKRKNKNQFLMFLFSDGFSFLALL
jgi:hypothetical protein